MRLYLFPITRSQTLIYCKRSNIAAAAAVSATSSVSAASRAATAGATTTGSDLTGGSAATKLRSAQEQQQQQQHLSASSSSSPPPPPSPPKTPLIDRVTAKANETWVKWESAPGGWKKKVTGWGNQAFARIPYQEWGLKSIPPLSRTRRAEETRLAQISRDDPDGSRRALRRAAEVEVAFPPSLLAQDRVLTVLKQLSGESKGEYRRRIWWSILAMPLTIPFMLIPVIPNLPFFYLVFRAWSYWRAQAGCAHVEHLLTNDLITPRPSKLLQRVYDEAPLHEKQIKELQEEVDRVRANTEQRTDHPDALIEDAAMRILGDEGGSVSAGAALKSEEGQDQALLYPKGHGKAIALAINMPEVEVELERAHDQVSKAQEEQRKEKAQGKSD